LLPPIQAVRNRSRFEVTSSLGYVLSCFTHHPPSTNKPYSWRQVNG
jgi:hypothetical protein